MDIESQLLNALKVQQQQYALESLKHPSKRDAFEYGYRVGIVEGIEMAINTLLELIRKERDDENF